MHVRTYNEQLGGHMQSFMFATWCPPGDRAMVSRLVSRQDRVESSFDGGVFRMDWWVTHQAGLASSLRSLFYVSKHIGKCMEVVECRGFGFRSTLASVFPAS